MTATMLRKTTVARDTAPGRAVASLAVRQVRRGALIVAAVCGSMSAIVAIQYRTMFQGALEQSGLRALTENPAIRVLFGAPVALDDAGGFTVWRTGLPVLVLAGVWALLAATRITRGEEDAGRYELLLAGRLRTVDVVHRCMAAMAGSALLIGAAVGVALIAAGTAPRGAIVYAAAVCGVTLVFAMAGVLAGQILPTRSAAVGVTVALLGVGLLLRMLADGVPQLAWLAWTTPFGLTARAAPYAGDRIGPLLVLGGIAVGCAFLAQVTAARRDLGGGLLDVPTRRAPRTLLLQSVAGFAVRRAIPPTVGWAIGITAYFLLVGVLIASIVEFLSGNPQFAEAAAAAGFSGLGTANGFAAALFALLPIATGLYAASRLSAVAADEKARRWTLLFAAPLPRARLIGTEIAVVIAGLVALHLMAGVAIWAGAAITGVPFAIEDALAGVLNSVPVAGLSVGAAALALGWLPGAVGAIGALPVVGGFLLDVAGQNVAAVDWVANFSPFVHLAAVPHAPPNWVAGAVFVAIGATAGAVGTLGFARRDLVT